MSARDASGLARKTRGSSEPVGRTRREGDWKEGAGGRRRPGVHEGSWFGGPGLSQQGSDPMGWCYARRRHAGSISSGSGMDGWMISGHFGFGGRRSLFVEPLQATGGAPDRGLQRSMFVLLVACRVHP